MLREFIIVFSVFFQDLFLSFFQTAHYLVGSVFFEKMSVNYKKIFVVFDVLNSDGIKITSSVGQVINAVKQVGFPDSVSAYKTINFSIKIKANFRKIFIIKQMEFL